MRSGSREIVKLQTMIEELRRIREGCEPKRNDNPRYHALSAAISQINRAIVDVRGDEI